MQVPKELLDETGRWHARDVQYWAGRWDQLVSEVPNFATDEFRASDDTPSNPHMRAVIRLPRSQFEYPVPVGVVSNSYTLAQHKDVAEKCFEGIRTSGISTEDLRCELGLTALGEWMNLRIYLPESYAHSPGDGAGLGLRLECFNSVDGSSRLLLWLGWLRFVCSNGLVIGETKAELKAIHNKRMDLSRIPEIVREGLGFVDKDQQRLVTWEGSPVATANVITWVNTTLAREWGKKAACRVFHICTTGWDVEYDDPFAKGAPTTKPVRQTQRVPGAPERAQNLYDVSQTLSWVASRRNDSEERVVWQSQIPRLIDGLATLSA